MQLCSGRIYYEIATKLSGFCLVNLNGHLPDSFSAGQLCPGHSEVAMSPADTRLKHNATKYLNPQVAAHS